MKTQNTDHVPGIDELEHKADGLFSLMLSLCEERICKFSATQDARASSLAHAAMAVQTTILTFMALVRIR